MKDRAELRNKFLKKYNITQDSLEQIPSDASFRNYYKIKSSNSLLMDSPPSEKNIKSYVEIANYLKSKGFSVPTIIEYDTKHGFAIIEYLGDEIFSKILNRDISIEAELYSLAMDTLINLHNIPALDGLVPYYSDELLLEEANIFIEWYLPVLNGESITKKLKEEYQVIWRHLLQYPRYIAETMVHRDYHSDNLIWIPNREGIKKVGIIDFQDLVIGSPIYDIVSLLEDARREVSENVVNAMINKYITSRNDLPRKDFLASYSILGAQRNLKIMGVFARKSVRDKNNTYLKLLPRVWKYVEKNLKHPLLFPLKSWIDKVISSQIK